MLATMLSLITGGTAHKARVISSLSYRVSPRASAAPAQMQDQVGQLPQPLKESAGTGLGNR